MTRGALTIKGCPPELADALAFLRNNISFGSGELENVPERISYAQFDPHTKLCRTYPNALHLVHAAADKLGLSLETRDHRLRPPLNCDRFSNADYPSEIDQLFKAVTQSASSGLLIVPAGGDRTSIVCGLVRLLPPDFKILVTGDDSASALRIHRSLAQALTEEKIGLHLKNQTARSRIMLTHLDALAEFARGDLAYSGYGLRDFDAWICDEAQRVSEPGRFALLNQFRTVYSWGLTSTPVRADNSHQLLSVIFGPVLWSQNSQTGTFETINGHLASGASRVFVFPLPGPSIAADLRRHEKFRIACLKNPALGAMLRGIDASLPETARVMVLIDSIRLAILLQRQLPHYIFLDAGQTTAQRQNIFDKLRSGEMRRLLIRVCGNRLDLPEADYLIDCTFACDGVVGGVHRTSDGRQQANHIMPLSLGCEQFFNDGIAKLQKMNALDWQVTYMFDRKLVEQLPFARAPLLPELGTFPER